MIVAIYMNIALNSKIFSSCSEAFIEPQNPVETEISWWSDLVNVFDDKNPTLILFKWTKGGLIENPSSFSCEASTSLDNPKIIHIPDVLLPDGITRLWVDLEYSPAFSTAKDDYYEAKNYGIVFSN